MSKQQHIGGTFAPPLSDELLVKYRGMIDAMPADSQIRDAMSKLMPCCEKWWNLPESSGTAKAHASGRGLIVTLDEQIQKDLWNDIPWGWELDGYGKLFDGIDPISDKDLRNAAFHLLWHAKELELDREPMSCDKL